MSNVFFPIFSVYGRVEEKDVEISNILEEDTNILKIKVVSDTILTNNEHVTAADTKKTCLDVDNNLDTDSQPCEHEHKVDNGTALLLTPYIEEGRINEARNACKVTSIMLNGKK